MRLAYYLFSAVLGVALSLTIFPGPSSNEHWAGATNDPDSYSVIVYPCSGGQTVLLPGRTIKKHICGISQKNNTLLHVKAKGTGSILIHNRNRSGSSVYFDLTSDQDTVREVVIRQYPATYTENKGTS